jgi:predicted component of type VI protein secretion system
MNYVLQVVRGRSASTTLKLADGVTVIGRHDDCLIRIKSSQVSRRHCELYEVADKLTLRDLGSSNGTFVNGKKVSGQQALKHGDEVTVGAVTLRVAQLGQAPISRAAPGSDSKPKAADTAVLEAIAADEDEQEEFEMEFDDGDPEPVVEGIPLADDAETKPTKPKSSPKMATASRTPAPAAEKPAEKPSTAKASTEGAKEDDAIAQFLLDLKLDDED